MPADQPMFAHLPSHAQQNVFPSMLPAHEETQNLSVKHQPLFSDAKSIFATLALRYKNNDLGFETGNLRAKAEETIGRIADFLEKHSFALQDADKEGYSKLLQAVQQLQSDVRRNPYDLFNSANPQKPLDSIIESADALCAKLDVAKAVTYADWLQKSSDKYASLEPKDKTDYDPSNVSGITFANREKLSKTLEALYEFGKIDSRAYSSLRAEVDKYNNAVKAFNHNFNLAEFQSKTSNISSQFSILLNSASQEGNSQLAEGRQAAAKRSYGGNPQGAAQLPNLEMDAQTRAKIAADRLLETQVNGKSIKIHLSDSHLTEAELQQIRENLTRALKHLFLVKGATVAGKNLAVMQQELKNLLEQEKTQGQASGSQVQQQAGNKFLNLLSTGPGLAGLLKDEGVKFMEKGIEKSSSNTAIKSFMAANFTVVPAQILSRSLEATAQAARLTETKVIDAVHTVITAASNYSIHKQEVRPGTLEFEIDGRTYVAQAKKLELMGTGKPQDGAQMQSNAITLQISLKDAPGTALVQLQIPTDSRLEADGNSFVATEKSTGSKTLLVFGPEGFHSGSKTRLEAKNFSLEVPFAQISQAQIQDNGGKISLEVIAAAPVASNNEDQQPFSGGPTLREQKNEQVQVVLVSQNTLFIEGRPVLAGLENGNYTAASGQDGKELILTRLDEKGAAVQSISITLEKDAGGKKSFIVENSVSPQLVILDATLAVSSLKRKINGLQNQLRAKSNEYDLLRQPVNGQETQSFKSGPRPDENEAKAQRQLSQATSLELEINTITQKITDAKATLEKVSDFEHFCNSRRYKVDLLPYFTSDKKPLYSQNKLYIGEGRNRTRGPEEDEKYEKTFNSYVLAFTTDFDKPESKQLREDVAIVIFNTKVLLGKGINMEEDYLGVFYSNENAAKMISRAINLIALNYEGIADKLPEFKK